MMTLTGSMRRWLYNNMNDYFKGYDYDYVAMATDYMKKMCGQDATEADVDQMAGIVDGMLAEDSY